MGDLTASVFWQADGAEADTKQAQLEQLATLADKLDAGTSTAADRTDALTLVVNLVLGRTQ